MHNSLMVISITIHVQTQGVSSFLPPSLNPCPPPPPPTHTHTCTQWAGKHALSPIEISLHSIHNIRQTHTISNTDRNSQTNTYGIMPKKLYIQHTLHQSTLYIMSINKTYTMSNSYYARPSQCPTHTAIPTKTMWVCPTHRMPNPHYVQPSLHQTHTMPKTLYIKLTIRAQASM